MGNRVQVFGQIRIDYLRVSLMHTMHYRINGLVRPPFGPETDTSAGLWLSDRARFEAPELYPKLLSGLPRPSPRPSLRLRALSKCPPLARCTV